MNTLIKNLVFLLVSTVINVATEAAEQSDRTRERIIEKKPYYVPMTIARPIGDLGFIFGQLPLIEGKLPEEFKGKVPGIVKCRKSTSSSCNVCKIYS